MTWCAKAGSAKVKVATAKTIFFSTASLQIGQSIAIRHPLDIPRR
jgi:hypothetical protein